MEQPGCTTEDGVCRCVLSDVMALLGRKYAMQVGCVLAAHGPARFGTVEAHLPDASTSTLSTRLEELVAAGLVERRQYDEVPPRVEYDLTEQGVEMAEHLEPLAAWAVEADDLAG